MFFPTREEIKKAFDKYKKAFWSDKPEDKKLSWSLVGVLGASGFALLVNLGHWFTELVILFLLVNALVGAVKDVSENPEK